MKAYKLMKQCKDIKMPWEVKRFLTNCTGDIFLAGDQASLGEDYGTIGELRKAIDWLADQFGGKIKWEK